MNISAGFVPAVLAALCWSSGAHAQPSMDYMSVFGLPLGQPLALPRCPQSYLAPRQTTCFREMPASTGERAKYVKLVFPDLPQLVRPGNDVGAFLIDGALEGVAFSTGGGGDIAAQLRTIDTLSAKYGKPTAQSSHRVQNAFGAAIDDYIAEWHLSGLTVKFEGAADMNQGFLSIFTDKMNAASDARRQAVQQNQRKL